MRSFRVVSSPSLQPRVLPGYAQPGKRAMHDPSKTMHRVYRLEGDSLLIGTLDSDKRFHAEGLPRKIHRDSSGRVVAIDEWTRIK